MSDGTLVETVLIDDATPRFSVGHYTRGLTLTMEVVQQSAQAALAQSLQSTSHKLIVDFGGVDFVVPDSIDALIGPLIFEHGPVIIDRLVFGGCGETLFAIIEFVIAERIADYGRRMEDLLRMPTPSLLSH